MNKLFRKFIAGGLAVILIAGLASCKEGDGNVKNEEPKEDVKFEFTPKERTNYSESPTAEQLVFGGEWQERWLSIPDSRLVLNPYEHYTVDAEKPQSFYMDSERLPFNLGYLNPYTTNQAERYIFKEFLMILDPSNDTLNEAGSYSTWWSPAVTGFDAEYESGMTVSGKDYFYNEKAIIRNIKYTGDTIPVIGGVCNYKYVKEGSNIVVEGDNFTISISFNTEFDLKFYEAYEFAARGLNGSDEQQNVNSFWRADFKDVKNNNIIVSVAVDSDKASKEDVIKLSNEAANTSQPNKVLKDRCDYWTELFKKVPIPGTFEFENIDSQGVTTAEIDRMYYTSWTLIAQSLLPPSPEVGYNYRQVSAGKPSMWAEGHPTAPYTAAWDSIYGMQMYAFLDPDIAWDCLTGFMSLMERSDDPNRNGMIAGESLPLNRARTAWMFYQMKPDKDKLREIYDELDTNLYWGMNHPYWIHKGNNPLDSDSKDPAFTSSVLIDMPYMVKICNELGDTENAAKWGNYINEYLEKIPKWHFTTTVRNGKKVTIAGGSAILWVVKALYSPLLDEESDQAFMNYFKQGYNPKGVFAGLDGVKLEEISYTIYGLYDNGYAEYAKTLNECSIREVVRASGLGENYTSSPTQPRTTGVRPSIFGTVQLISGIWNRNGYRYDMCVPTFQNFFSEGSMKNIHFGDKVFDYTLKDGKVTVTGSYVGEEKVIDVPENKVVSIN